MREGAWKQIVAAGYDTGAAIDRGAADFAALEPMVQQAVIRAGVGRIITSEAKRQRLLIPENGGPAEQMPLFAAVQVQGRWLRVSYLRADLAQLTALYEREKKSAKRTTRRVARLRHDLGLYRKHPDLPSLLDVWHEEHVEFRMADAA